MPFRVWILVVALAAPITARAGAESTERVYPQSYDQIWAAARQSCETVGWRPTKVSDQAGVM